MGGSRVVVPIGLCLNGGRWMGSLCLCPPNVIGERCQFGATTFNLTAGMGGGGRTPSHDPIMAPWLHNGPISPMAPVASMAP